MLVCFRQNEVREALLSLKQIPAVAFNVCESLQCAEGNLSSSLPQITDYENICTLIDQHCVCVNTNVHYDDVLEPPSITLLQNVLTDYCFYW